MWFKYALTYDARGHLIAKRWSISRGAWIPTDRKRAEGLAKEGLAEFAGYL